MENKNKKFKFYPEFVKIGIRYNKTIVALV